MDKQALRIEWKARITDYQSSGLTIKDWCQTHNLNYSQFHYWHRKFKAVENPIKTSTQWFPLDISDQVDETGSGISIRVGGVVVEVKPHFNPDLLLQVVRTLNAR